MPTTFPESQSRQKSQLRSSWQVCWRVVGQSGVSPPCCLPQLLPPPPPAAVMSAFDLGFVHLGFRERRDGQTWWVVVVAAVLALVAVLESPETMAGAEFFCERRLYLEILWL